MPHAPFDRIVREALEGYASGQFQSQAEIKRFFESFPEFPRNKAGKITQQRVTDILTQPIYTGYICSENYKLNWLKGHHEPLISVSTFEAIQRRREGTAKAPLRKNIGDDFALRGFVVCADCNAPLRSCWTKGRTKHYPYYLCQTKSCESYGKSIPRDQVEDGVGNLVRQLQPRHKLFAASKRVFARAWHQRCELAKERRHAAKQEIAGIETETDALLQRIVKSGNDAVIQAYEDRIGALNRQKALLHEQMTEEAEPVGTFEEKLEPALTFLSNPWKIWESGHIGLRRLVLKLAFAERIQYCRKEGARTAEISFPFKALGMLCTQGVCFGAQERTRTSTSIRTLAPEASASTNSATWAGVVKGRLSPATGGVNRIREES